MDDSLYTFPEREIVATFVGIAPERLAELEQAERENTLLREAIQRTHAALSSRQWTEARTILEDVAGVIYDQRTAAGLPARPAPDIAAERDALRAALIRITQFDHAPDCEHKAYVPLFECDCTAGMDGPHEIARKALAAWSGRTQETTTDATR